MLDQEYKAKTLYQQKNVAKVYDYRRFRNLKGKITHAYEVRALEYVINKYFGPGGKVIDVPCGTGRLMETLVRRGYKVTGVDISEEMLNITRKKFSNRSSVSFRNADAEALPFDNDSFDYLVSYRLMTHLPRTVSQSVLAEMLRVTRKVAIINYHFHVNSPLMLFNRIFRKRACSVQPLLKKTLVGELQQLNIELCEIRKVNWYGGSSSLVVIRKK